MTGAGTLAINGPFGQEARIAVLTDDFLVGLRVGASATAEDSWWAWSEDRDGLLLFLETILDRQADWVLLSPAAWPSLEHWARQRAGRPARQHTGVEAWAIALE